MNYDDLSVGKSRDDIGTMLVVDQITRDVVRQIDSLLTSHQELIIVEPELCLSNPVIAHLILERLQILSSGIKKLTFVTQTPSNNLESDYYEQFMERYQFLPTIELLVLSESEEIECCLITSSKVLKVNAKSKPRTFNLNADKPCVLETCNAAQRVILSQIIQQLIDENEHQMVVFETHYIN
ncbi:hypothetical protein [Vibrio palustris]|uniref:Uncharacterized protein n=1 Tax=Vibrio palustris TaxID=1918946 RepID=A0A1R4B4T1_9VIBR|nr:hypothetical protein [Vibrio palustris]SJL83916.1 hypothetical protein VPAL9027_01895 [Vibrio palustris]